MRNRFAVSFSVIFCLLVAPLNAAFDSAAIDSQKPLTITRVTPGGKDVPPGRQIVIQFNRAVVPVGRMERTPEEIPVEITPACNCQWRWLNTSALACQLDESDALKPSTLYRITVYPGIKAEDGTTLSDTYIHEFITERPGISYTGFKTWRSPGMPVVRVTFNQNVFRNTVEQHLYMMHGHNRYALNVAPDPDDRVKPYVRPIAPASDKSGFPPYDNGETVSSEDGDQQIDGLEARRVWLVSPQKELPPDADVSLNVEPGLVSPLGPEPGVTSKTMVDFGTYPEFRFLGVRGWTNDGREVTIIPPGGDSAGIRLNPLSGTCLVFSAPVIMEAVKAGITLIPDLAGGRTDYDPWANTYSYSHLSSPHERGRKYTRCLPEQLKAWQGYHVGSQSAWLRDEFGRQLPEPIDMIFYTDHRRPDFRLTHQTAVLEKQVDTTVPLVITNIDEVVLDYTKLTAEERCVNRLQAAVQSGAEDTAFAVPLGVREILNGESGAVYGRICTKPDTGSGEWDRKFFAQITPFQLHVKSGHFNTLVWVTDLSTGNPVAGADVTIYKDSIAALRGTSDIQAVTDRRGIALLPGVTSLDPELKTFWWGNDDSERLFVRVAKDNDMALLPLDYRFQINTYQVSEYSVGSYPVEKHGHIHAWGTTAQGIYRAGDTIRYKLYVRDQDNDAFIPPKRTGYKLTIVDPTGKVVHEVKDVTLSEFGAFDGEFTPGKNSATGWYDFELSADYTEFKWHPVRVLVSDFTPAPFRVENEINGTLFHQGDNVKIMTYARLHSGGPYAAAGVRVTATLTGRQFSFRHREAKKFYFDSYTEGSHGTHTLFQEKDALDDEGRYFCDFTIPDKNILYGQLMIESVVQDDRGKYIAASSRADYVGRDRYVGLKQTRWVYEEDKSARVECLVVDEHGEPAEGTDIRINVERLVTKASRVKGAGNAYLTHYTDEWVPVSEQDLRSERGPVSCQFIPSDPGSYQIRAAIKDTQGRPHSTRLGVWVAGKGLVVWQQPEDNRLEIIPEENGYNIGDTARYLIKNPFPGATALITIERYGIIKHWAQVLEGSTPIIEFPVEPDFAPGFYLSVVVTAPRVSEALSDDASVDLGKPALRVGYVSVAVKDPYKEIKVAVDPDKEIYKPGDTVKVKIRACPRHRESKEAIELAVTVLDEAVFDLLPAGRDYYDPYKGFYYLDGLDLENYNLLTRLVGLQKVEKKGASPGGGGGGDISLRSEFSFVSYWNPSLRTDKRGRATIEFQVPDNLTGWRIFVMAVTPTDRMGLGDRSFKVNRPTEIRPVMPNQVTEGDRFKAGFNVMNRTDKPRELKVSVSVSGPVDSTETGSEYTETVTLDPYKRKTVWMPVKTDNPGRLSFKATAADRIDGDGLQHAVPVKKRRSLETAATYGTTTAGKVTENVLFPENMQTDAGEIGVVLAPAVIGNVEGAFTYMRDYPFSCWEQILTKGVMAGHYIHLKAYLPETVVWEAVDVLPQKALDSAADFQAPNGGMAYFVPSNAYVSPYLSAYTALAFNWLRKSGYHVPENVDNKLHDYLSDMLKKDVLPTFYTRGMSSTVRAVALAALAAQGRISLEDLERYQPHVEYMSLFGKAQYLQAALKVQGARPIIEDVTRRILSHAGQTGGKILFNETLDDAYNRILASPLRANAAILSAFMELGETDYGAELIGDMPFKMVRAITQARGNRDHWENTQENMFCMNALIDYSRIYESEAPTMTAKAYIDGSLLGETDFKGFNDNPVTFRRPMAATDPGRKADITIYREGKGRLYYTARLSYAPSPKNADRTNAGIDIRREYSVEQDGRWILLDSPMEIKRGELVRVDIFLSLPSARNFVVVDDPVPGGLEPVNRDLATTSAVDAAKGNFKAAEGSWWFRFSDWFTYNASRWCFYHREMRHDAVRFYSDYLPAGNYHLSYTAQAIAAGEFVEMPVSAEEMYDPDVFGKGLPGRLHVTDAE